MFSDIFDSVDVKLLNPIEAYWTFDLTKAIYIHYIELLDSLEEITSNGHEQMQLA
jgi:hypothetical protein